MRVYFTKDLAQSPLSEYIEAIVTQEDLRMVNCFSFSIFSIEDNYKDDE